MKDLVKDMGETIRKMAENHGKDMVIIVSDSSLESY